jgi:hypothetical protein
MTGDRDSRRAACKKKKERKERKEKKRKKRKKGMSSSSRSSTASERELEDLQSQGNSTIGSVNLPFHLRSPNQEGQPSLSYFSLNKFKIIIF